MTKLPVNVLHFTADVDKKTILEHAVDFWNHHQSENSRSGQVFSYAHKDENGKEVTLTQKAEALSDMILTYAAKKLELLTYLRKLLVSITIILI
jgi:hypothetical protein